RTAWSRPGEGTVAGVCRQRSLRVVCRGRWQEVAVPFVSFSAWSDLMRLCFGLAALLASVGLLAGQARAVSILAPGDAIIAIDADGLVPSGNSGTPGSGNENAPFAFDG